MPLVPLRRPAAALAASAALLLAGCGAGSTATVPERSAVVVAMSEFRLTPQDLVVTAGRRTIVARNDGTMVHRLEIRSEDGTERLAIGAPLRPGEEERLVVSLRPGTYVVRCAQERHNTLGEHGTLEVREPPDGGLSEGVLD